MHVAEAYQLQIMHYQRSGHTFYKRYEPDLAALTTFLS